MQLARRPKKKVESFEAGSSAWGLRWGWSTEATRLGRFDADLGLTLCGFCYSWGTELIHTRSEQFRWTEMNVAEVKKEIELLFVSGKCDAAY